MCKRRDHAADNAAQNVLRPHVIELKEGAEDYAVFIGGFGLVG
jgi:hypothetical protein